MSAEDSAVVVDLFVRVGGAEPTVSADGREFKVSARDAPAALQVVLTELGPRGIRLFDAGMRRPTLGDVSLRFAGRVTEEEQELAS